MWQTFFIIYAMSCVQATLETSPSIKPVTTKTTDPFTDFTPCDFLNRCGDADRKPSALDGCMTQWSLFPTRLDVKRVWWLHDNCSGCRTFQGQYRHVEAVLKEKRKGLRGFQEETQPHLNWDTDYLKDSGGYIYFTLNLTAFTHKPVVFQPRLVDGKVDAA